MPKRLHGDEETTEEAVPAESNPTETNETDEVDPSTMDDAALDAALEEIQSKLATLRKEMGETSTTLVSLKGGDKVEEQQIEHWEYEDWKPPPHCIPIRGDVRSVDFKAMHRAIPNFDVIMMDPPWQLATANPTRGVALGYSQLGNDDISSLPVEMLQTDGFLFVWVINARYAWTLEQFEKWGYTYATLVGFVHWRRFVDDITWVKVTCNRRPAKSHGFYLQHAKESCLVAKKGRDPPGLRRGVSSDVIYAERRGQSQKPTEIYDMIEELVPNGKYLEIFARRNNLRDYWVSVGNEL